MQQISLDEFRTRRNRAFDNLKGGIAVIPSARMVPRNGDSEFPFRQNSDFLYLTGLNEPDATLLLLPDRRSIIFMQPRSREHEVWTGYRMGLDAAPTDLGVDLAFDIATLEERLPEFLIGSETLFFDFGNDESFDKTIFSAVRKARELTRRRGFAPSILHGMNAWIHDLRSIKSPAEIALMREAAEITRRGHVAAMQAVRPGMYEYELQAILEYEYRRAGSQSVAYESIVAAGNNATVLHYVSNRSHIKDGDLVLIDSGAEVFGYASDVTRTFPANGHFQGEQRALYEIVLHAFHAACDQVRAGVARTAYHEAAVRTLSHGLLDLGLLHGSLDEIIETQSYAEYYMHGTGHWLGLDVHDAGRYRNPDDSPVLLTQGMALTVEPGIYIRQDAPCDPRFHGIGIRIEDDVIVTHNGFENITASIPKTIDEISALMCERAMG